LAAAVIALTTPIRRPAVEIVNELPLTVITVPVADPVKTVPEAVAAADELVAKPAHETTSAHATMRRLAKRLLTSDSFGETDGPARAIGG
jgi:hypothetical protein